MITLVQFQNIIREIEKTHGKVIGTKNEDGIVVSLKEESQAIIAQDMIRALFDLWDRDDKFYDEYGVLSPSSK